MVTFGIPLKGPSMSSDWERVCALFFRTLASAAAQKSDSWRIVVACDETPSLPDWVRLEHRISFIPMGRIDSITPLNDKGRKVNAIACWLRNQGGGYLMLLDADDLVSNQIANLCESSDANGFVSGKGYLYLEGSQYLRVISEPWKLCGSCTIVNWGVDELPSRLATDVDDLNLLRKEHVVNASHASIPMMMAERGRRLTTTPHPLTIYSCANGENISISSSTSLLKTLGKRIVRTMRPLRRITPEIIEEFSLYPLAE